MKTKTKTKPAPDKGSENVNAKRKKIAKSFIDDSASFIEVRKGYHGFYGWTIRSVGTDTKKMQEEIEKISIQLSKKYPHERPTRFE
jgi:hypothetical protein